MLNGGTLPLLRIHNHIMDMFNAQKLEGFFDPIIDSTTAACRGQLLWWAAQNLADAEVAAPRLRRSDQRQTKQAQAAVNDVQL